MLHTALCCGLVYTLATFVQRVSGFGMGIVAIMILPYLIGSHGQTAAYTNMLCAVSAASLAIRFRKEAKWSRIVPILAGSFIATFIFVRVGQRASFDILEKVLGGVLVVLSVYFMFFKGRVRIRPGIRNGFLTGLMGGTLNGLFSTGGPPVVMYMLGTTDNHAVYFATMQAYFAFNNIYASSVRFLNGQINASFLPGFAGGLIGMLLGNLIGGKVEKYIPEKMFLKIIYALMALSGLMMIF